MSTITVNEKTFNSLTRVAKTRNSSIDDLLSEVAALLDKHPSSKLEEIANYLLLKNAELYKRLA